MKNIPPTQVPEPAGPVRPFKFGESSRLFVGATKVFKWYLVVFNDLQGCIKVPVYLIFFPVLIYFNLDFLPQNFRPQLDILPNRLNIIGYMLLLHLSLFSTLYSSLQP